MSDAINKQMRPVLSRKALLKQDGIRSSTFLLLPERVVKLNASSAAILRLCDGRLSVLEIIDELKGRNAESSIEADVVEFLSDAIEHGWVVEHRA